MTTGPRRWALLGLLTVSGAIIVSAAAGDAEILRARYWAVPPEVWKGSAPFDPPEKSGLDAARRGDVGVAFSGGGTRSASATVGQLRGLLHNQWLSKVRYITAVSGGSWIAVPFTYAPADPAVLLGEYLEPQALRTNVVEATPPAGTLAREIVDSRLLAAGGAEAAKIWARSYLAGHDVLGPAQSFATKYFAGSTSETYANMLGRVFIKPLVPHGTDQRYTWDRASLDDIKERSASLSATEVIRAAADRPFLIVGGTMIYQHPAFDYPRLIPVEYTPLYTGVRQQFGTRLGGIYVAPYGYDVAETQAVEGDSVRVKLKPGRPFTLADVIASSGAAPLLALYRGQPVAELKRATAVFPTFNHYTVRVVGGKAETQPVVEDLLHGDGGFSDNLGLMPLLARKVTRVLVFVNASEPIENSKVVESFFWPLDQQDDADGDRSMNAVFHHANYWKLLDGLKTGVEEKGAAVSCGCDWDVKGNEIYNVAPYGGLTICWVYNQSIETWRQQLPTETQTLMASKGFKNFPWFRTFEQNAPSLIRLEPAQVSLLGHLATWTVTNPKSRVRIENALFSEHPACDQP